MIDFKKLKQIYQFSRDLSLKDIQVLLKAAKSKKHEKKALLIEEGTSKNELFLIKKGLVRCSYINDKGDDITFQLIPENRIVTNFDKILYNQPSRFNFVAFEATHTLSLDYDHLQTIFDANPKFESNRKYVFQKMMRHQLARVESFVLNSPEERYLKYIKDYPDLINRVPDKYIAHVLGITPVSLSRIRKRISDKSKKTKI
jgi:CRP-like cAMP-binding protein